MNSRNKAQNAQKPAPPSAPLCGQLPQPREDTAPLGKLPPPGLKATLPPQSYGGQGGGIVPKSSGSKPEIPPEWLADFDAAAQRPLATRFRYAFIHTYKPVLDDAPFRAFDTTADYRRWCEENLPDWLGYGRL
jgi:hypothetical protein